MKIALYFIDEGKEAGGTFTFAEEVVNYINSKKFDNCEFILIVEKFNKKNSSFKKINKIKKFYEIKRGRFRSYFETFYLNSNIINQNFNYKSPLDKICMKEKLILFGF